MRSSKSRSRSKSNRQRSLGNIVNRVFDSSGPESKVRGTPQQIIDKYLALARDAQLSNDRVAEQNFLQHAEHYTRMLGEAQREMQREQDARQAQGDGGGPNSQNNNGQSNQNVQQGTGNGDRPRHRSDDRGERGQPHQNRATTEGLTVGDSDEGPGLVETPEARLENAPTAVMMPDLARPEGGEPAPAPKKPRAPRKPREKRDTAPQDGQSGETSADAAE